MVEINKTEPDIPVGAQGLNDSSRSSTSVTQTFHPRCRMSKMQRNVVLFRKDERKI